MLKGLIGRRVSERVPFGAEVNIKFEVEGKEPVLAVAANISPGGLQFTVPKGKFKLLPEDEIELVFHLPQKGDTIIRGEICYFSNTADAFNNPQICYGVKFLNLDLDTWNSINEYCLGEQKPDLIRPIDTSEPNAARTTQSLNQDTIDQILNTINSKPTSEVNPTAAPTQPATAVPPVAPPPAAIGPSPVDIQDPTAKPTPPVNPEVSVKQPEPQPTLNLETNKSLINTPGTAASDTAEATTNKKTSTPFIQTSLIDMVFGEIGTAEQPTAPPAKSNLNPQGLETAPVIADQIAVPAPSPDPELPITPEAPVINQPEAPESKPTASQLTSEEILALRQVEKSETTADLSRTSLPEEVKPELTEPVTKTPVQPITEPAKPVVTEEYTITQNSIVQPEIKTTIKDQPKEPAKSDPPPHQAMAGSPSILGNATTIFKSNSLASMDQSMIDHMVRNLNRNQPQTKASNSTANNVDPGVVSAIVRLKNSETINGITEKIDFGGLLVRLPNQVAINTSLTIDLSNPETQPISLNGTATSCDRIANSNDYLVGIFFDNLTHLQIDRLQALINKPR